MRDTAYNIDPSSISAEEWQARCDLAALYRLIAHFRWTDHIDTHISARVPGEPVDRPARRHAHRAPLEVDRLSRRRRSGGGAFPEDQESNHGQLEYATFQVFPTTGHGLRSCTCRACGRRCGARTLGKRYIISLRH